MIANDFVFRIAILDSALWITVSDIPHPDCVSNMCCDVPSEEQCNQNKVLLHPGHFRMDSEVYHVTEKNL